MVVFSKNTQQQLAHAALVASGLLPVARCQVGLGQRRLGQAAFIQAVGLNAILAPFGAGQQRRWFASCFGAGLGR